MVSAVFWAYSISGPLRLPACKFSIVAFELAEEQSQE